MIPSTSRLSSSTGAGQADISSDAFCTLGKAVTSRSESKSFDDKKVDLIDTEGKLFFNPQLKSTINTPDYFGIAKECPFKDKPFVIFWKKIKPTESTFRSLGEVAIMQKEFFYLAF